MKPNFLVIGAQRAGTTWLYECLREHPEIFLPETKELHYFDLNHEKGDEWYFQHFEEETLRIRTNPKSVVLGNYRVQIGAFRNKDGAYRYAKKYQYRTRAE